MAKAKNLSLGIDLGGTKVAVGLCHGEEILMKAIFPTHASADKQTVNNDLIDTYESYLHRDIPILDYLKKLEALGEKASDYRSIYYYF